MTTANLDNVMCLVRKLVGNQALRDLPDGELLGRFRSTGEEAAFAVLVERHGPMVLGVCRRLLGDPHDAEDAFQATFLVLARNAGSVRNADSLAGWLHGVAQRVARKARARAAARRVRESRPAPASPDDPTSEVTWRELCAVLDEEVG